MRAGQRYMDANSLTTLNLEKGLMQSIRGRTLSLQSVFQKCLIQDSLYGPRFVQKGTEKGPSPNVARKVATTHFYKMYIELKSIKKY